MQREIIYLKLRIMNRKLLWILAIISLTINTYGQSEKNIFIAFQPAITVEPFYDEGEFDVNIFPFIFETPLGERINIRICPTVNYHFGGSENGVSDLGVFTVFPVFFNKTEEGKKPFGFYVGPVLGFGRNLINEHYTTTLAIEPGYMFESKKKFTISLGIQLGGSYFTYDNNPDKWVFHWGPKVSFGFWL
ncbi:MAG: hypothetical protein C0598_06940 [Marinilabiliales bacterium]|nr:MAG: hypothetical protein C0598_06940 [Marinilabiliales bacterium]